MDLLSQHEAFLRAIFDSPEDDTPRLVYADFLQENGEEVRAEFIRVQCELAANMGQWDHSARYFELVARERELLDVLHFELRHWEIAERERIGYSRGFLTEPTVVICPGELENIERYRSKIIRLHPHWFAARNLAIQPGWVLHPEHIDALFKLPVIDRISEWNLSGDLTDTLTRPVIFLRGIETLALHAGCDRLHVLDLSHNHLDDRAALELSRSPQLKNLRRLTILEGNNVDGALHSLIERFGLNVVE